MTGDNLVTVHYTGPVWRSPEILASVLPPPEDASVAAILEGLCRATGATACTLLVQLEPNGASARYRRGKAPEGRVTPLVIDMEREGVFKARWELYGAGAGPASSPRALEALRPMVEGALLAVIGHWSSSHRLEILAQILDVTDDAILLVDAASEPLYINPTGEKLLRQQAACAAARGGRKCALWELVVDEVAALRSSGARLQRRSVRIGGRTTWEMEIVALNGPGRLGHALVVLSAVRLPDAGEIQSRLGHLRVSRREAEVLALVLRGRKGSEIAAELGISEYTVKDHLKHAYAKLDITAGTQVLARLADEGYAPGA